MEEQEKEITSIDTSKNKPAIVTHKPTGIASIFKIETPEDIDKAIDFIYNSKTYNINFIVRVKQEDGSLIEVIDRAAIGTALLLGNELGFKPFESIILGRRLGTPQAIMKIHRGRSLGLDPITALQNIYIWGSEDKEIMYTSIHIIHKCLNEAKVKIEVLEDGSKPYYIYTDTKSKEEVEFDERVHVLVDSQTKPAELQAAIVSGKRLVNKRSSIRALVRLTRGETVLAFPYSLQDAIDAELYAGTTTLGTISKGKDNWNKHPRQHLVKMSTIISARIILGDKLNGIYIPEELPREVQDVEYINV
jgi:hypothetical protein